MGSFKNVWNVRSDGATRQSRDWSQIHKHPISANIFLVTDVQTVTYGGFGGRGTSNKDKILVEMQMVASDEEYVRFVSCVRDFELVAIASINSQVFFSVLYLDKSVVVNLQR